MTYGLRFTALASIFLCSALFHVSCKRDAGPLLPGPTSDARPGTGAMPDSPPTLPSVTNAPAITPVTTENLPKTTVDEMWAYQLVASMQSFYLPTLGAWKDSWTANANALIALIDFTKTTGNTEYLYVVNKVFEANKGTDNYIRDNFADNALWGIAWVKAYDLNGDARYLDTAKAIADNMDLTAWDTTICKGGVIATRTDKSKRAYTNALFTQLAASIHNRIPGDTRYIGMAVKTWSWMLSFGNGLFNSKKLLNGALTADCKNDGSSPGNEAQGAYISAALEIYKAAPYPEYIERARDLAFASVTNQAVGGILFDADEAKCGVCNADERMNKGVFVRSLNGLQVLLKNDSIATFFEQNMLKIWNSARGKSDMIGYHWTGPFDSADLSRQASALQLFLASIKTTNRLNLGLHHMVTASNPCSPLEGGVGAVDGTSATKWCALFSPGGASLVIDLEQVRDIKMFKVLHAGAGGETLFWNTRDFEIGISDSAAGPWNDAVVVRDNSSSATYHNVNLKARYVRLHVTNGGSDGITRIAEFGVE
ncbi:MAG: discoidin domain-containing protein [Chitinophagaceae bacterium]|nr:discoidin domain-containing protein [Oligoflexus sp.]